jgi:hypothetical protein
MSTTEPADCYYVRLFNMACSKIVTQSDVTNKLNTESEHCYLLASGKEMELVSTSSQQQLFDICLLLYVQS